MATIITNDLRISNAKNFIYSLWDQPNENSFLGFGRVTPWLNDEVPPRPKNNLKDEFDTKYQTLSLEKVDRARAYHLIRKNVWKSGTVYDMYRHDYSYDNLSISKANNIFESNFVVMNSKFQVFACLYNGISPVARGGIPSTFQPQQASVTNYSPFYTSDGYQWIYLYTLTETMRVDATATAIPIATDYPVDKIIPGSINTVIINSTGTGYTDSPAGASNAVTHYFCRIVGDGRGGVARVRTNGTSFSNVVVVIPGQGYSYAKLDFTANRVYTSLNDLLNNRNAVNPRGNGDFKTTCIISPEGGWGRDLVSQLGGTKVGLFITSGYVNDVSFMDQKDRELSFRQISLFHNVIIPSITVAGYPEPIDLSKNLRLDGTHALNLIITGGSGFELLEEINQTYTVNGETRLARGMIVGWNYIDSIRVLRFIQDPNYHLDSNGNMWPFYMPTPIRGNAAKTTDPTYNITGLVSKTIAKMDYSKFGLLDTRYFNFGYSAPEYVKNSGDMIYVSNIQPIPKLSQQSEEVSIVIAY